jgi:hypothetical protein
MAFARRMYLCAIEGVSQQLLLGVDSSLIIRWAENYVHGVFIGRLLSLKYLARCHHMHMAKNCRDFPKLDDPQSCRSDKARTICKSVSVGVRISISRDSLLFLELTQCLWVPFPSTRWKKVGISSNCMQLKSSLQKFHGTQAGPSHYDATRHA